MFELADVDQTQPVDLYFGPTAPDGDATVRWIQTIPVAGWFVYLRIYGPKGPPSTARGGSRTSSLSDLSGRSDERNVRTEQHSLLRADHRLTTAIYGGPAYRRNT